MRLKKKIMSLVLTSALIVSLAPASIFAEEEQTAVKTADVEVSAQAEYSFIVPHHTITVSADEAENMGYEDSPVEEGEVTALDALVAMHEETFGEDFKKDKESYLKVSYGYVSIMFGLDATTSVYTVNNLMPNDGVMNEKYHSYTGYSVNQAVVKSGDKVDFAFLQDSYWMDNNVEAFYNGKDLDGATLTVGVEATLDVLGHSEMMCGCYPSDIVDASKENLSDAQFALVGDDGYTITPLEGAITDDNGKVTLKFDKPGTYHITVIGTEKMESYGGYVIMPYFTVNVAEKVDSTIMDDIWLQYDFKELSVGDTAEIYPRRVNQIVESDTATIKTVVRPRFNFEVVSGNSVELSKEYSSEKVSVKAVGVGTTIVKVTYDSIYAYGKTYASTFEPNAAYVVFDVNSNPADINIDSGIDLSSYDTIYYLKGETKTLDFTPTVDEGGICKVTVNGKTITADKKGKYSATLENRGNIIGITAQDEEGNFKRFYQVVDAREVSVNIKNLSREGEEIYEGDEVEVVVEGITLPVYKLATIYNPTMYNTNPFMAAKGSFVSYYINSSDGVTYVDATGKDATVTDSEVKGYGTQYNITDNSMIIKFDNAGTYSFSNGKIYESWWGSGLGADKLVENGGKPNMNAPILEGYFSELPGFKIIVTDKRILELGDEVNKLTDEVSKLKEDLNDANGQVDSLNTENETLKSDVEKANSELEKVSQELADAKNSLDAANADLTQNKKDLEDAKKVLEDAKKSLEDAKKQVEEVKANTNSVDVKKVVKFANSKVKKFKVKRGKKKAKLSWKKVAGADGYIVYRKIGKGKFKVVKTLNANTFKYTDKKLKKKKKYSYKVVAFMNVDDSKVSNKESKVKKIKIKK